MDAICPSAPQAQAPSGIPASTGPGPGPDPDRAERRLNPQAPKGRQPSHRRVLSIKL